MKSTQLCLVLILALGLARACYESDCKQKCGSECCDEDDACSQDNCPDNDASSEDDCGDASSEDDCGNDTCQQKSKQEDRSYPTESKYVNDEAVPVSQYGSGVYNRQGVGAYRKKETRPTNDLKEDRSYSSGSKEEVDVPVPQYGSGVYKRQTKETRPESYLKEDRSSSATGYKEQADKKPSRKRSVQYRQYDYKPSDERSEYRPKYEPSADSSGNYQEKDRSYKAVSNEDITVSQSGSEPYQPKGKRILKRFKSRFV